jgi:hypothetical protein
MSDIFLILTSWHHFQSIWTHGVNLIFLFPVAAIFSYGQTNISETRNLEDTKKVIRSLYRTRTYNDIARRKRTKVQTIVDKTLCRKLQIGQTRNQSLFLNLDKFSRFKLSIFVVLKRGMACVQEPYTKRRWHLKKTYRIWSNGKTLWRHEYYNAYVNALRIQLSKMILSV